MSNIIFASVALVALVALIWLLFSLHLIITGIDETINKLEELK